MNFRKLFSENIFFYKLYYKFYLQRKNKKRRKIKKIINDNALVFSTGYQRSGNTFLAFILAEVINKERLVSHLHKIAPIKIALKKGLYVVVVVRNPNESISSAYLKYHEMHNVKMETKINNKILTKLINDYYSFNKYFLINKEKVLLIDFNNLIKDTNFVVKDILKFINIDIAENLDENIQKSINNYIKKKSLKNTIGSSLPSEEKEALKSLIKKHVLKNQKFNECIDLYDKLKYRFV